MDITNVFALFSGLALFLHGMQMMSGGLEKVAGDRLKLILSKITSNPILGVLAGTAITALIQSSSATTVMVIGFVNTGVMTLYHAAWVIMGANIGTTVTSQLISLDIDAFTPILVFIGVMLTIFSKNNRVINIGAATAGFGILFMGMDIMSFAMQPLRESDTFISIMTKFSNPFIAIMTGAVFTAIIQSSSASIAILQALATGGVIAFPVAVYVLFGQNIGTCITAILASFGANRNAKCATLIHLIFNVTGTVIFIVLCRIFPVIPIIENATPNNISAAIANMHTVFNVTTTLILLPFGIKLVKLCERISNLKPK